MRADEVFENNKKIGNLSLKTETEIGRATLSVLTDISETLAIMTDLIASVYGRTIMSDKQVEELRKKQAMQQNIQYGDKDVKQ